MGVVHNLIKASRLATLWNRQSLGKRFEVIEVVDGNAHPENGDATLFGFDLSTGYNNSLLRWGLRLSASANTLPQPILDIVDLLCRHYAPQLNAQGLFQSCEIASLCLRSMTAIQHFSPNLFEGSDLSEFKVVGVYLCGGDAERTVQGPP